MKTKYHPPGRGQESVWEYPRPPCVEDYSGLIRVVVGDWTIAASTNGKRVLETSHPPVYYFPPSDIDADCLLATSMRTWCEWKGSAHYYDVVVPGRRLRQAAWYYPEPHPSFTELAGYVAFYPSKMDACYVGQERVQAQAGDFYGGWITANIVGPFKGAPGTFGW